MRGAILALALLWGAAPFHAQNLAGVKAILASGNTSYALLSDGTVWRWGGNQGYSRDPRTTPVRWGPLSGMLAVSPPLALRADGTVWAWPNPVSTLTSPVRVNGLDGAVAIAGTFVGHSLALKRDGTVWSWGYGSFVPAPMRLSGLTEVAAIAMGPRHALALKRDGTVWRWGDNLDGSLGDGLTGPAPDLDWPFFATPVQVPGLGDVAAIVAGYGHNLALKSDGTVWAWGFNGHGQLGDGATDTRTEEPIQVSGLANVVRIAAGEAHSVAVKSDGTVWTWGSNVGGQLGDGSTTDRLLPVPVSGPNGTVAVAAGRYHTLALSADGTVWAWGDDQFGQLGDGVELTSGYPVPLGPVQVGGLTQVTKIAAGSGHSLAMKSDGTLWAWGDNTSGQLGDGQIRREDWPDAAIPVKVSGPAGLAAIEGGAGQSFGITSDGAVWIWGANAGTRDGKVVSTSTPVQVSGLSGVLSVSPAPDTSGPYDDLAVCQDGSVWKWGVQYRWFVNPLAPDPLLPIGPVLVTEISDVQMVAGKVALKRDGTVWEWGASGAAPTQVSGLSDVVAVAAFWHRLALKRDGTVWGWGSNYSGELGDGTTTERATPVQVAGLSDVVAIDTRYGEQWSVSPHSVALKQDGTVWEWPIWEFKSSWAAKSLVPVQVAGLNDIVAIAEGGGHSLALKRDGTVWAWGWNGYGQLGVRTFAIRTTPVQVVGPVP